MTAVSKSTVPQPEGDRPRGTLTVTVYYEDTDCMGVVYHANYLKYLERGRSELIGAQGKTVYEWSREGFNYAVYKADMTFLAPARLADTCMVITEVRQQSPYRLILDQDIWLGDTRLVTAEMHMVCVDGQMRLCEFPDNLFAG